jgi:hypothetical protein
VVIDGRLSASQIADGISGHDAGGVEERGGGSS